MSNFNAIENLRQTILRDYDRLDEDDKFKFACHPGVSCFNQCCSDVNIFLTPYDIIRLKNRLKISSMEFLAKYTITPIDKNQQFPVVMLKMRDDETKNCHFVQDDGCSVYEDRPWSCRMYPLGLASPKEEGTPTDEQFFFLMKEDVCKGFQEVQEWTVRSWMEDQGVTNYDEFGRLFKEITLQSYFQSGKALEPQKMEMFHMVCYNIDKFRIFLYGSSFFERFEVDEALIKTMGTDDAQLLRFGFQWLKFALFGEKAITVKPGAEKKVFEAKSK